MNNNKISMTEGYDLINVRSTGNAVDFLFTAMTRDDISENECDPRLGIRLCKAPACDVFTEEDVLFAGTLDDLTSKILSGHYSKAFTKDDEKDPLQTYIWKLDALEKMGSGRANIFPKDIFLYLLDHAKKNIERHCSQTSDDLEYMVICRVC